MFGLRSRSEAYLHLDCVRVVACMGVVAVHAAGYAGLAIDARHLVDLFFVASGYMISAAYSDSLSSAYGRFLVRRVTRLGPLHWLTLLGMTALAAAGGRLDGSDPAFAVSCIIPNAIGIHSFGVCPANTFNGPSWSLSAEFGMYAAAPILIAAARRPMFVLALLGFGFCLIATGYDWTYWTYNFGVLRAVPSFVLGASLFCFRERVATIRANASRLAVAMAALVLASVLEAPAVLGLATAYSVAVLAIAADLRGQASGVVARVAQASDLTYPVYMIHVPVLTVIASGPALDAFGVAGHRGGMALLAVCLVIPSAWVAHVFFDRPARAILTSSLPGGGKRLVAAS